MADSDKQRKSQDDSSDIDQPCSSGPSSVDVASLQDDEQAQESPDPQDDNGALDNKSKSLIAVIMFALSVSST